MKINELARKTGLTAKTIRFYEDSGLIPPADRDANGYRRYSEADVHRFRFIRRCRDLRISLEDIRTLVALQATSAAPCRPVDELLVEQHRRVRETISELQALESQLQSLITVCHGTQVHNCGILATLQSE